MSLGERASRPQVGGRLARRPKTSSECVMTVTPHEPEVIGRDARSLAGETPALLVGARNDRS